MNDNNKNNAGATEGTVNGYIGVIKGPKSTP